MAIDDARLFDASGGRRRAFCGDAAFASVLRATHGASVRQLVERLRVALRDFGTASFAGDVAVLAMRVTTASAA